MGRGVFRGGGGQPRHWILHKCVARFVSDSLIEFLVSIMTETRRTSMSRVLCERLGVLGVAAAALLA